MKHLIYSIFSKPFATTNHDPPFYTLIYAPGNPICLYIKKIKVKQEHYEYKNTRLSSQ